MPRTGPSPLQIAYSPSVGALWKLTAVQGHLDCGRFRADFADRGASWGAEIGAPYSPSPLSYLAARVHPESPRGS